jgi:hypothetical protein
MGARFNGPPGQQEGCLVWDAHEKRPDIRHKDGSYYGGLHCGDTLDVLIMGEWRPARIEYRHRTDTWYLDGIENGDEILWLTVRKDRH